MKRFSSAQQKSFNTPEGVMTPLSANEDFSIIRINMPKGLWVERHSHQKAVIVLVTKGQILFDDGESHLANSNDVLEYGAEEEIGFKALEDSEAIFITKEPTWPSLESIYDLFQSLGIKESV